MFGAFAISVILLVMAGLLIDGHRRSWRAAQAVYEPQSYELRVAYSQYRRRTQASTIIGLLGVAIGMAPLVPRAPWPLVLYVAALFVGCTCIVVLAGLDVWATRQYYGRLAGERLAEQIKLAKELQSAEVNRSAEVES